jgi:hypothetical protein
MRVLLVLGLALTASAQPLEWRRRELPAVTFTGGGPPVLAFDSGRGRTVLLTREDGYARVWEWDGAVWERRGANPSPLPRLWKAPALAHDDARGRTVLFGGQPPCGLQWGCPYPQETWEWDGSAWSLRPGITAPPGRWRAATTYDSWRQRVLLFGGDYYYIDWWYLGDLWEWDGSSWRQLPSGPPPRTQPGLAFDAARGRTVLFGGWNGQGPVTDTWEWDGASWHQAFPAVQPTASGPMIWHAERQRVLLAADDGTTWEWDGQAWSRLLASGHPPAFGLAHDFARGRTVLIGVATDGQFHWELAPPISVRGPGHPGGGLGVTWSVPPRVGQSFCLGFSLLPPQGAGWHLLLLAAGPGLARPAALGPPGTCAPAWVHLEPQAVLVATGDPAAFCLAIPSNPALAGTLLTLQGASLAVGGCWFATDAVEALVLP